MSSLFRFILCFIKKRMFFGVVEGGILVRYMCVCKKNKKFFIKVLANAKKKAVNHMVCAPNESVTMSSQKVFGAISCLEKKSIFNCFVGKNELDVSSVWVGFHCMEIIGGNLLSFVTVRKSLKHFLSLRLSKIDKLINVDIAFFSILRFFLYTELYVKNMALISATEKCMEFYSFHEDAFGVFHQVDGDFIEAGELGLNELLHQCPLMDDSIEVSTVYWLSTKNMQMYCHQLSQMVNFPITPISIRDHLDCSVSDIERNIVKKNPLQIMIVMGMSLWGI